MVTVVVAASRCTNCNVEFKCQIQSSCLKNYFFPKLVIELMEETQN